MHLLLILHFIFAGFLFLLQMLEEGSQVVFFFFITLSYITLNMLAEIKTKSYISIFFSILALLIVFISGAWFLLPLVPFFYFRLRSRFSLSLYFYPVFLLPVVMLNINDIYIYVFFWVCIFLICYNEIKHQKEKENLEAGLYESLKDSHYIKSRTEQSRAVLQEKIRLSRLEERNLISQKIHDQIGHTLTGVIYQLDAVKVLLEDNPDQAEEIIDNCGLSLREGLETLRSGVRLIKPGTWELQFQQIKELLASFESENNIKVIQDIPKNTARINNLPLNVIYSNIQEGLTNILKHSCASNVYFSIKIYNKFTSVRLEDNGSGSSSFRQGTGLTGMDERTKAEGGQLIIDGSKGFSITMNFYRS